MIWRSRASGLNRSCASRPMRMPIGIKTPNLPWMRVPSLIHSSGVSERHGDEAISANANVTITSSLIKGAPCCVGQLSFVFDSPGPCKYGHATKDQDKATLPVSTYAEWRKRVAALLERKGIWAGVLREKRWRDLFIGGATPEYVCVWEITGPEVLRIFEQTSVAYFEIEPDGDA